MIEMESSHCQVVRDSLTGEKAIDEQSFASLAILTERLERVKKLDKIFGGVTFSSDVKRLKSQKNAVTVG